MATWPAKTNYATGDVLTAAQMQDIGNALNSLESAQYAAGKNKIINGDFRINQRAFSSTTTTGTYGFDRWSMQLSGATGTYSAETFTLGAAPVAGYEGTNFARLAITTGNDNASLQNRMESVRTFAGQTVTVSFWAKGTNPTTEGGLYASLSQIFGSGGSPSSAVTVTGTKFVLTANWTRYSFTLSVPSISGKTLGTTAGTDYLALIIGQGASTSTDSWTLDLWGVQVEAGNTATAFQTATGTLAGELQAAQRYYYRLTPGASGRRFGNSMGLGGTTAALLVPFPVSMRTEPTALEQSGTAADYSVSQGSTAYTCSAVPTFATATTINGQVTFTVATGLVDTAASMGRAAATGAYLGWSAEL